MGIFGKESQDLYELQGYETSGSAKSTLVTVTGSGALLFLGASIASGTLEDVDFYVTVDGGTERTIDLDNNIGNTGILTLPIMVKYSSSLDVSFLPDASVNTNYYVLYSKDK